MVNLLVLTVFIVLANFSLRQFTSKEKYEIINEMKNKPKKIPQSLQGILWSVKVEDLDPEKDKIYIINQILSYGTLSMIKWLFKTYSKKTILEVFLKHPIKDYRHSRFHFVKNFLLGLGKINLNPNSYVKNLPRNLG